MRDEEILAKKQNFIGISRHPVEIIFSMKPQFTQQEEKVWVTFPPYRHDTLLTPQQKN